MARLSATTALLFLLLSLLAVAHCRPLEAASATGAESAAVVEVSDENGPPNSTLPAEAGAVEVVLPAEQRQHGFLRLPSHWFHHHRPCRHGHGLFHCHLWWPRHHGAFGGRFQRHIEVPRHLSVFGESREVKPVAEPDPDRSLTDSDGEGEVARMEPSLGDADEVHAHEAGHEDEGTAVRAWKKEMLRRWFHHHGGMRLHRHHDKEEGHEQEDEAAEGLKRFHHHRHHDEEEEKDMMRKRFLHAEHDDDEDEEVEKLVRRFRKAIMRRRFGHGRRFHHHHQHYGHSHAEEAEKADAQEEGGVVSWIKGIVNRF